MTPAASQAPTPAPALRPVALTPVLAQTELLPAPVGEIVPKAVARAGDPLAGLDIIEPPPAAQADATSAEAGGAAASGADWLSPEGALRGEFGELVDSIPDRPSAQAPVFPTPPAPWPATPSNAFSDVSTAGTAGDAGAPAYGDVAFEDALGASAGSDPISADPLAHWTPDAADGATFEATEPAREAGEDRAGFAAPWADLYGAQADAIHGEGEAATGEHTPGPDAASYLASEWPELPTGDPSTLPTPVMPGPAVLPGWDPAGPMPASPVREDPLFAGASEQDDDAFGWGRTPQETPAPTSALEAVAGIAGPPAAGVDDWAFAAADPEAGSDGRPIVTASSLAAAEALERVAVQLREGTLRADGFSPALGEAAALSAVLAALLGVDARWDVQR